MKLQYDVSEQDCKDAFEAHLRYTMRKKPMRIRLGLVFILLAFVLYQGAQLNGLGHSITSLSLVLGYLFLFVFRPKEKICYLTLGGMTGITILYLLIEFQRSYMAEEFLWWKVVSILVLSSFFIGVSIRNINIKNSAGYKIELQKKLDSGYIGEHALELTEKSIILVYGTTKNIMTYQNISEIYESETYFILYTGDCHNFDYEFIPLSVFTKSEDKQTFLQLFVTQKASHSSVDFTETLGMEQDGVVYRLTCDWTEEKLISALVAGSQAFTKIKSSWRAVPLHSWLMVLFILGSCNIELIDKFISDLDLSSLLSDHWFSIACYFLGGILVFSNILIAHVSPLTKFLIKRRIRKDKTYSDMLGKQVLCLSEDKITVYRKHSKLDTPWNMVHTWRKTARYLLIFKKSNDMIIIIPLTAFRDQQHIAEVTAYIDRYVAPKKVLVANFPTATVRDMDKAPVSKVVLDKNGFTCQVCHPDFRINTLAVRVSPNYAKLYYNGAKIGGNFFEGYRLMDDNSRCREVTINRAVSSKIELVLDGQETISVYGTIFSGALSMPILGHLFMAAQLFLFFASIPPLDLAGVIVSGCSTMLVLFYLRRLFLSFQSLVKKCGYGFFAGFAGLLVQILIHLF